MATETTSTSSEQHGVFSQLDELIRLRFAAKDLDLYSQRKALSRLTGQHVTNIRGRGIDFAEVRPYQAGDDIRSIDWRVTARMQKPFTKLYQEEKEKPVIVAIDQSTNMYFGSQRAFKSVAAAEAGSLIAWAALAHGDRVGGLVFNEQNHEEVRPRRNKHAVLRLLNATNDYNHALLNLHEHPSAAAMTSSGTMTNTIAQLRRITKPGSAVFIISDFAEVDELAEQHLYQLSRHNDVIAIKVFDPLEQHLPKPGSYNITDGEHRYAINTGSSQQRSDYLQQFEQHLENLRNSFGKIGVPLISLSTEDSAINTLRQYLGMGSSGMGSKTSAASRRR